MIYFIREPSNGAIKIGYSKHPRARLRALQISLPFTIDLIGEMPGGPAEEIALHRQFSDLHLRGEWFRPERELANLDAELPRPRPQYSKFQTTRPTQRQLIDLGVSQPYAGELLSGKKTPSLRLAKQIQEALAYPMDAWMKENGTPCPTTVNPS